MWAQILMSYARPGETVKVGTLEVYGYIGPDFSVGLREENGTVTRAVITGESPVQEIKPVPPAS